jgi:hypothetical protein
MMIRNGAARAFVCAPLVAILPACGSDSVGRDSVDNGRRSERVGVTAEAQTLSSCGTITSPGSYVLTGDLTADCPPPSRQCGTYASVVAGTTNCTCLSIQNTRDVTIDCNGHSIIAAGNPAVAISSTHGYTLQNCTVQGFFGDGAALVISSSSNGTLTNDTFNDCNRPSGAGAVTVGVFVSDGLTITGNVFHGGLDHEYARNTVMNGNQLFGGGAAVIYTAGGGQNTFTNNSLEGLAPPPQSQREGVDDGFSIESESGDVVSRNSITDVWDMAVETSGLVSDLTVDSNWIDNAWFAAVGGYYSMQLFDSNIVNNTILYCGTPFSFQTNLTLGPGQEDFSGNSFKGNRLGTMNMTNPMFINAIGVGNTFWNNDFGFYPAGYLFGGIQDRGNNRCYPNPAGPLACSSTLAPPPGPVNAIDVLSSTVAGASTACNGSTDGAGTGLAYSGTPAFGPDPKQDWRYVLALIYGGLDITTGIVDCAQPARASLVSSYSNLFQNGCTNDASICADSAHAPGGGPAPLWHAFRPDDASPVSAVFASILGLSPASSAAANAGFGASPYCNALNWDTSAPNSINGCDLGLHDQLIGPGGVVDPSSACAVGGGCGAAGTGNHRMPPPGVWGVAPLGQDSSAKSAWDVLPTYMQDNDPIRRPCLGVAVNNPNRSGEEVCNLDGALGLVLPIVDTSWIEGQSYNGGPVLHQYPTVSCDGSFAPSAAPQVFDCPPVALITQPPHITFHDGECPSGDSEFAGGCIVPYSFGAGTSACINDPSMTPFLHVRPTVRSHGRVYNLFLTDGTTGGSRQVRYAQYPIPGGGGLTVDMAGAFNRIHQVETVFDENVGARPGACQQTSATDQLSCLVQADPCSIGFAGDSARIDTPGSTDAVRIGQTYPTSPGYPLLCPSGASCQQ